MKILCVSHYYPPHMGGLEVVARNQATRLAQFGHEVTVVTSKVSADEISGGEAGVYVIRVPALNILEKIGVPFPFFSPTIITTLYRSTKSADIVHIHDAFYISSFIAAVCALLNRKPVILMQHIAMINHPSKLVMLTQRLVYLTTGAIIFRISKKIITLNDRVEEFIVSRGVSKDKFLAIPNGVDMKIFFPATIEEKAELKQKYGFNKTKKIIIFVGRFVPKKGFQKLLGAKDAAYQIVFCGGDRPESISLADTEVLFLGKRTPREVAEIYRASDIFVLPSEDEGFPLSVQEAMATALPIITSNDRGYARYGFDTKLFMLIEKNDAQTLKHLIQELIVDDTRLTNMGKYSLQYAQQNFEWNNVMVRLEEVYKNLIS